MLTGYIVWGRPSCSDRVKRRDVRLYVAVPDGVGVAVRSTFRGCAVRLRGPVSRPCLIFPSIAVEGDVSFVGVCFAWKPLIDTRRVARIGDPTIEQFAVPRRHVVAADDAPEA